MFAIIVFIIILGLLIFVHELGHFVTARRNGIKAEEFGFGFPPRLLGAVRNEETGKFRMVWGSKNIRSKNTVYSLNWIPLGGFVKIKGEDGGSKKDTDSFSSKSAWIRVKVLAAGVAMNFVLAWFLISLGLAIGAPEPVDNAGGQNLKNTKIQISEALPETPAAAAGLQAGDEILKNQIAADGRKIEFKNIVDFQDYIASQKGREVSLKIARGGKVLEIKATPRTEYPEGQGALGVSLVETAIVRYPWYQAIYKGLIATFDLIVAIIAAFGMIIKNLLVGAKVGADISGPVGIAVLTGQVTALGLVYVLQFAAILSVNLGIINALPIPALDGGRILFVVIEKINGRPVSQKVEQMFHTIGFILLIMLMVFVTFKDVAKFVK
ncbi:MAG: Zinc metalloprotease [Patescibacteria group bacterium]|nr:Zinc metalloprotease [Patescibacteria group bacterium]